MPQAIAIGDFDGDGANDFVTANWPQDVVSVRINNGDGTFGGAVTYDSGIPDRQGGPCPDDGQGLLEV